MDNVLAGMTKDIKQIIVNAHQKYPKHNTRIKNPEVHQNTDNPHNYHNTTSQPEATAHNYETRNPESRITVQAVRKRTARQHDTEGVSNFHLGEDGQIIRTHLGHPRSNYCFITSHTRVGCKYRKEDLSNSINCAVHPDKGLLPYKNYRGSPHTVTQIIPVERTINGLTNEVIAKICKLLPFKDRCKFGATNRRFRFVLTMPEFWRKYFADK